MTFVFNKLPAVDALKYAASALSRFKSDQRLVLSRAVAGLSAKQKLIMLSTFQNEQFDVSGHSFFCNCHTYCMLTLYSHFHQGIAIKYYGRDYEEFLSFHSL